MMKKHLLTCCLLLAYLQPQLLGQNIFSCAYGEKAIPPEVCSYLMSSSFKTNEEAEAAVDKILKPMGLLQRNFVLVNCPEIDNAMAITPSNGIRYIVYDNQFMQRVSSHASDWAALSILAHEIGHHLAGHTNTGAKDLPDSRQKELEADRFSGFALYRLGATLSQAQQAVRLEAREKDDTYSTHPSLSKRLAAIKEGWDDACSQDPRCGDKPPPDLPNFVRIQGGSFQMGSNDGESDEKPIHQVTLSDFYMARHELTLEEFSRFISSTGYVTDAEKEDGSYVTNSSGSWEKKAGVNWRHDATGRTRPASEQNHPVTHVSWNDAVAYCNWRSEQGGLSKVYTISGNTVTANWSANGYRLPTEAEWEFAARSRGKDYKYAWGNGSPKGNIGDETAKRTFSDWTIWDGYTDGYLYTAPVDQFEQGDLGLFNMTGNVWEWCWDWKDDYPSTAQTNPTGPSTGSHRVVRGGSWSDFPAYLRCAFRDSYSPDNGFSYIGFRLARAAR